MVATANIYSLFRFIEKVRPEHSMKSIAVRKGKWVPYDQSVQDNEKKGLRWEGKWCMFWPDGKIRSVKDFSAYLPCKEVRWRGNGQLYYIAYLIGNKVLRVHYFDKHGDYDFSNYPQDKDDYELGVRIDMDHLNTYNNRKITLSPEEQKTELTTKGYDGKDFQS